MTGFAPFERNSSVMDVLFCIIDNKNNVKKMVKVLKQPQSSVSRKMKFLLKNGVVIKKKWDFEINWKELDKVFLKEARKQMEMFVKDRKEIDKYIGLFNEKRVKSIIETFTAHFMIKGMFKRRINEVSIQHIISNYFYGMLQMEDKELEKMDKRFVELRMQFEEENFERFLFLESEVNMNRKSEKLKSLE